MADIAALVAGGDMVWEVKPSFISYIRSLEDGEIVPSDGAEPAAAPDVGWRFPFVRERQEGPARTLEFRGQLRISAHGGMLLLILMDPWLTFTGDKMVLSVVDLMRWPDRSVRQALGIGPTPAKTVPGSGLPDIRLQLAAGAEELFNGVYPAGTDLAPAFLRTMG